MVNRMADLLIKGMEMPKNCKECELMMDCDSCEGWEVVCVLKGCIGYLCDLPEDRRLEDCPLVEVEETKRIGVNGEWETIYQEARS